MNIDNSGPSVVLDPKSQAAIDAVRDRITLLDSENARLTKLKVTLEDSVRKVEADLAYKTAQLDEVTIACADAVTSLNATLELEAKTRATLQDLQSTEEQIKRDLDEQAAAISDREKSILAQASHNNEQTGILAEREAKLDTEIALVAAKKVAIEELLTKL
jgi:hypothetical protein